MPPGISVGGKFCWRKKGGIFLSGHAHLVVGLFLNLAEVAIFFLPLCKVKTWASEIFFYLQQRRIKRKIIRWHLLLLPLIQMSLKRGSGKKVRTKHILGDAFSAYDLAWANKRDSRHCKTSFFLWRGSHTHKKAQPIKHIAHCQAFQVYVSERRFKLIWVRDKS